jgi:hypothetical protein
MTAKQLGHDEFVTFSSGAYNAGFTLTLYVDGGIRSSAALVSLNKELDKPFCQVKLGVRTLTFALHQDGYPIECSPQGRSWSPVGESKFDAMSHYRVLLKPGMPEAPAVESDPDGF